MFRLTATGEPEVVIKNAGTVKYDVGEILIDTIRILSTVKDNNIVEIQAIPDSNDVIGLKDLYVQLSVANSTISTGFLEKKWLVPIVPLVQGFRKRMVKMDSTISYHSYT